MILHLSQRFLTLALTFTLVPSWSLVPNSPRDAAPLQVVRGELDEHFVPRHDANEVHPHLAADVREDRVAVLELHLEHRVRKGLGDCPLHLDDLFVARFTSYALQAQRPPPYV